jgi:hypothetical protein
MQIREEQGYDEYHRLEEPNIDKLLDFIWFKNKNPVGYSGFEVCPGNVFDWIYLFVPSNLRSEGLGLAIARATLQVIGKNFGMDAKIQMTVHAQNKTMRKVLIYAGCQLTYVTGVASVERILKRPGNLGSRTG